MTSILINGLLEYTSFRGVSWPDYWEARDLMDGMTRFRDTELYQTVGNNRRDEDGYRYGLCLDLANAAEPNFTNAFVSQTLGMGWYARSLIDGTSGSFESKMKIQVQRTMGSDGVGAADHSSAQWNAVIYRLANPGPVLQTLSVASFADNGGGSYTISWTVPVGTQSYRIKWGTKRIVDWIGFDPAANRWIGDPATTMNWFAANTVATPSPAAGGSVQTMTVSTGTTGLTAANFSVKAYVSP
jgi:hypothetical protein